MVKCKQDATRKSLEHYLAISGVKAGYVAGKIGCHFSTLSHWRAGSRPLPSKYHIRLVEFLLNKKTKL